MTDLLERVRRLHAPDAAPDFRLLRELARTPDLGVVRKAGGLLAAIPDELLTRRTPRPLRIAVVPAFTCDALPRFLEVTLRAAGIRPRILVTAADQLPLQLTDPDSELARFAPDVTLCLLDETLFLSGDADLTDLDAIRDAAVERTGILAEALRARRAHHPGPILVHTVPLPRSCRDAVIAFRSRARLGRIWRELNNRLLDLPEQIDDVHTLDWEAVLVEHPGPVRDERLYRYARMAWSVAAERLYAGEAARFCRAVAGLSAKCLVLDLDNTLWGGVLGDDGPENIEVGGLYPGNAYLATQQTAATLRHQGVLLGVASKNDPGLVERVFAEHPGLALRADDFAATAVNWEPKDGNLTALIAGLNIGADAVVFADDSRFECELVGTSLPEVTVVHLDGDPSGHAGRLLAEGGFDVLTTTGTDRRRTELYRARAERTRHEAGYTDRTGSARAFLHDLDLRVTVRPADDFLRPRIRQLALRTNQFTLLGPAAEPESGRVLGVDVTDRFGDEGTTAAVWLAGDGDRLLLRNLVLSCRVFSRGIEFAILAAVTDLGRASGFTRIEAGFRPTGRNDPARRFLEEAGFVSKEEINGLIRYALPLTPTTAPCPDWITLTVRENP
ncbi:HAD-superfamily phosphatase, subfamily IIIC:FkbH [Actinoplanes italicus]|uniref:D-glyceryl-ACP synthase n=1 Tax=Actinoplanes italicus TaxID=113567 RepID=A0A2T0JA74_9ACTN|nr:HAD-IIIC family phosphatase [Actinoplanes italicus]PRX04379.1 D-glyceryl-ACP synthase [Actinoplanes italicus]GIE37007.1 HAD-superfamily phosphatase, subfamily IIIC:FkbH [Actinoplanes italicus]